MRVKLLIDEDMSPRVAVALCADGVDACHVRDPDMLGATDKRVLERAFVEDRILVTANVDDFVKLAAQTACSLSAPVERWSSRIFLRRPTQIE